MHPRHHHQHREADVPQERDRLVVGLDDPGAGLAKRDPAISSPTTTGRPSLRDAATSGPSVPAMISIVSCPKLATGRV